MLTAKAEEETIGQVAGVRFNTNERPETEPERRLQEIQADLSGGTTDGPPPTVAHLNYYAVAVVDGPSRSYISLWVPREKQTEAAGLLEDAGFTVT